MTTREATPSSGTGSAPQPRRSRLRDVALFFAAPFISLYYAALMPMAGIRWLREQKAKGEL